MHARGWSSKYLIEDAKTIEDMIAACKEAVRELEAMRDDGVTLRLDPGVSRGNALLVTDDDDLARKYRFCMSDHQGWAGPGIMLPGHPLWNDYCDVVASQWPLEERLGFRCGHTTFRFADTSLAEYEEIDVRTSLARFYANGARCDCDVLYHMDPYGRQHERGQVWSLDKVLDSMELDGE